MGLHSRVRTNSFGWPGACALLTLAVAIAFPLVAWCAFLRAGKAGVIAAAVAAGVCWFGSTAALLAAAHLKGPNAALAILLSGMALRMGIPLVVGVALLRQGGMLALGGVFGLIVVFFLLTLVVETLLSLRLLNSAAHTS